MEIILNILVILLLGLTITFCWRLNKKIVELRDSKKDLSDLVNSFDKAIINAQKNVNELKQMTVTASEELQQHITQGKDLAQDLAFLTDSATRIADNLDRGIDKARKEFSKAATVEKKTGARTKKSGTKKLKSAESALAKTKSTLLNAIKRAKQGN